MKVLLNAKLAEEHVAKIRGGFPRLTIVQTEDPQEAKRQVMESDVLVTWWDNFQQEYLFSPKLRWLHALSAGVDGFLLPPILEGKILLTNSRGIHGLPISEHVFALMLAFSRGLNQLVRQQTQNKWGKVKVTELRAKTLGIIGLGSIGQEIARLGAAFGMRVLAVRRNPAAPSEDVKRVVGLEGLEMVLRESDYLVLAVPLTAETNGLIGIEELRQMKPSAIIINIARGEVLRQGDLVTALKTGVIAGAGLDVFETEPLPADSPLWQLKNCIITPHCAALSPQYLARATDLFCRNLDAFIKGEPMPTLVDPNKGY